MASTEPLSGGSCDEPTGHPASREDRGGGPPLSIYTAAAEDAGTGVVAISLDSARL
jgi:hypothetical protein